jgi:hypothetical protein
MVTIEQTEKTETGLDVAIKAEDGRILAWTYSIEIGNTIAEALNNVWKKADGSYQVWRRSGNE